jgi:transglutaminase-like putative cysteine protease
MDLSAWIEV